MWLPQILFQEFLRVSENKSELFEYLATQASENLSTDKEVFFTYNQNALTCSIHMKKFRGCLLLHKGGHWSVVGRGWGRTRCIVSNFYHNTSHRLCRIERFYGGGALLLSSPLATPLITRYCRFT